MDSIFDMGLYLTFFDRASRPFRRFMTEFNNTAGLRDFGIRTVFAGQALQGAAGKIQSALRGPIDTALAFEQAMAGVGAVSNASGQDLRDLTDLARDLGGSTTFTAMQVADAQRYLAMAGFDAARIGATLPGVLNLARAGATGLGRAADISSDILTAFSLNAGDMIRVTDVLTATFTSSNTTLETLGESMKYVAPIATEFGVGLEQASAMAGLLGSAGIKGSDAGTTLRAMLLRLSAPTGRAARQLQALGVATQIDGEMRGLTDILGDMAGAMRGFGSADRLKVLKTVFGEEPASGVAKLMREMDSDKIAAFTRALEDSGGTAARIAAQMGDTGIGAIQGYKSAIESLHISLGSETLPIITDLVKHATGLVRVWNDWAKANPELAKWLMLGGMAIAGVAFALAKLVGIVGTAALALGYVAPAIATISAGLLALKTAFLTTFIPAVVSATAAAWGFAAALLANPLTWIVVLIAGLIAALVALIVYWDDVVAAIDSAWEWIGGIVQSGIDWIVEALAGFDPLGAISGAMGAALDYLAGLDLFAAGRNLLSSLWKGIKSLADLPIEAMSDIAQGIRDLWPFSPAKAGPLRDLDKMRLIETIAATIRPDSLTRAMAATAGAGMMAFSSAAAAAPSIATHLNGAATAMPAFDVPAHALPTVIAPDLGGDRRAAGRAPGQAGGPGEGGAGAITVNLTVNVQGGADDAVETLRERLPALLEEIARDRARRRF